MRQVPLLRVDGEPGQFQELLVAARTRGAQIGWLDWFPEEVQAATDEAEPVRRVRATATLTELAVRRRGAPVLADLIRSHFLGCDAVLVAGEAAVAPRLRAAGAGWVIEIAGEPDRTFTSEGLLDALRRPSIVRHAWLGSGESG